MVGVSPSESATAPFDGYRLSKGAFALLSQKVTKARCSSSDREDIQIVRYTMKKILILLNLEEAQKTMRLLRIA